METEQGWVPKLVAVDADGTIVGGDDRVPNQIGERLRQISAQGTPVVLVTGRAWLSSELVLDQLQIPHMYCVCNNGATVVSYPPLEIHRAQTFDPTPIIEVVRTHPTMTMAVEDFGRGYRISAPFVGGIYELHGELRIQSWEELAAEPVSRIILRDSVASEQEFASVIAQIDLTSLYHSKGGRNWLDIGAEGVGKDAGLAFAAAQLGVAREDVLALGDGYNDIDMVGWAGRGVALDGAPPELMAVADAMAGPFPQGTLDELDRWFR
ncbi:MAG: Cof-type HAD-IIB family hydrolase [Propionibacteriaceae bacterium]|nr:Cof-type HAD-IIB family hydrolase [Propionibacteriaceae bacterium]